MPFSCDFKHFITKSGGGSERNDFFIPRNLARSTDRSPRFRTTHTLAYNLKNIMASNKRFRFSIDRGGTFTDIYCEIDSIGSSSGTVDRTDYRVLKLLSEDPDNYNDAPTEGIRRLLESETGIPHPRNTPVSTTNIEYIRMGTTVATNALLERKGEPIALLTTRGFADLQLIGNQSRPKIFDLEIKRPDLLYSYVAEIDERVVLCKSDEGEKTYPESDTFIGVSHEKLYIEKALDEEQVTRHLREILARGIKSIAVVFMHSYTFAGHEQMVKKIAEGLGFEQISLSSEVVAMVRMVPRGCTTCVDAYLTPIIKRYLKSFTKGFDEGIANVNVSFMQSDGGLTPMDSFCGNRAILSGPAGGVVGYAMTSYFSGNDEHGNNSGNNEETTSPVIGFDMGGTSTDVSRFAGVYEHVFETTTAGVTIQSPQLDINTVAAGGGSRLFFRNGLFVVGPESAGAHPGPVCYRKGGVLAVTDANVILGRVQPHLFPAIFGPNEDEVLDLHGATAAFEALTKEINAYSREKQDGKQYSVDEVAYGFIRVANEAMARPIRNLTTMKGYDVTKHSLATFGGAGPQHCCAIAKSLGMRKIYVHRYSGILSAYGLSLADVVVERQEPFSGTSILTSMETALKRLDALEQEARAALVKQGFSPQFITCTRYLNCRYQGTDTAIMTSIDEQASSSSSETTNASSDGERYMKVFIDNYVREYGFQLAGRDVLVDDVRVRAVGHSQDSLDLLAKQKSGSSSSSGSGSAPLSPPAPEPSEMVSVFFEGKGRQPTGVYSLSSLSPGHVIPGPAIIMQSAATCIIEPGCRAHITSTGDIIIYIDECNGKNVTCEVDPIYLSIFSHRFMGIAEQMGRTLQRTSISVNIKERLDFSCALFDPKGGLVANAPHLPVHLGAMSEAVRYQVRYWGSNLKEGDVLVSNHPQLAGGSHLPDITVITPIFHKGEIVFFVASRGHHADVGGIAPGSMPPLSKTLEQEGAAIVAFKLVEGGVFQEAGISELLHAPGKLTGNFGTRNLSDNLSDLRAQVAANKRGAELMHELVREYGLDVVQAYMVHIQDCAEESVRAMLREFSRQEGMDEVGTVVAEDFLDDGTPIKLSITIDRRDGSAIFDFEGTGPEMYGNLNAPPAVTASAIIYCLRCLLPNVDIPLNQGCLAPVKIRIPTNSVLNPSANAAVVGGNVLTSQRVTDVVLKAFKACAASQGCMNNLTFGDDRMGYYETIAGGAGAGPTFHGCSGVHTHMTNCFPEDHEVFTHGGFMDLRAVQEHFKTHATLDVACYVEGRLEFHPITEDKVTIHTGMHDHVLFQDQGSVDDSGRKLATADISLLPTSNHRMYLAMGSTIGAARHWPQKTVAGVSTQVQPPFEIHTADDVMAAGARDASTDVQLKTHFELGLVDESPFQTLPFVAPLGLTTNDHVDAFLELYGYWVGGGWLDPKDKAIMIAPAKPHDCAYVEALLARLPLKQYPPHSCSQGGYTCSLLDEDKYDEMEQKRCYRITEHSWWSYFVAQHGHKYDMTGKVAEASAGLKSLYPWVLNSGLGIRRRRLILAGLRFADGDEHLGSLEGGRIGTSSVHFRDQIVQLALLAGYSVVFWRNTESGSIQNENANGALTPATMDQWSVSYTETNRLVQPRLAVPTECRRVTLTGTVWCVTVPTVNQLIMVRRVLEVGADGAVVRASRPTIVGNTRITDPEILERRYPVILRQFSIRKGSGGAGKFRGGDGIIRELEFTRPLVVSILSERRALQPFGMAGGEPAQRGQNLLKMNKDKRIVSLGGKNTVHVQSGDVLAILSPGGGGYGSPNASAENKESNEGEKAEGEGGARVSHRPVMTSGSLLHYQESQETV